MATKEFLARLDEEPKKFCVFKTEFSFRQISSLLALVFLFFMSIVTCYVAWGTNTLDNYIQSYLIIDENSDTFDFWVNQPPATAKIYLFNYTNAEEVEHGMESRFKVQEVGPYIYKDNFEKLNPVFSEDKTTVTYQERHFFDFDPELSRPRMQNDRVIVPNMPMLSASKMATDYNFLTRVGLSGLFKTLDAKPFVTQSADKFIFGYEDNLFKLAKGVLSLTKALPIEKIGLLSTRNGILKDVIEVYTGKHDLNKIGQVKTLNGMTEFDYWLSRECNLIAGSEGALFPYKSIREKAPVEILFRDIGRKFKMEYEKDVPVLNGAITAHRYIFPDNVWSSPSENPSNQCYCSEGGTCAPHGLFNVTKTSFDSPMFLSHPHFYNADPSFIAGVDGLDPQHSKHGSFIDIHPRLAFATQGWNRVQMNIQVKKSFGIPQLAMFDEDMILPIAWMEFGLDAEDLPEVYRDMIYEATYLPQTGEFCLKYGSILLAFTTLLGIMLMLRSINKANVLRRQETVQRRLLV